MTSTATDLVPVRYVTDPPDFTTYEAVTLHQLKEHEHPWPNSRHVVTDENLHCAAHNLRLAAADPRLPKQARQWAWHCFTLVWKAREGLETIRDGLAKHHDAERRRDAEAAAKRAASGED